MKGLIVIGSYYNRLRTEKTHEAKRHRATIDSSKY